MSIDIAYDAEVDAAYISLNESPNDSIKSTISVDEIENGEINLDFDATGKLCGIEVLDASKVLPQHLL